jgi:hypothetical protein
MNQANIKNEGFEYEQAKHLSSLPTGSPPAMTAP